MFIFRIMHTVPYSNKPIVKDIVASLHSYFTFNLLLGFAILVSFKQFGGRPIECMLPMGFSGAWEQYAENYCYAQDTYFVPFGEAVASVEKAHRKEKQISYYQWISFFLIFEAFCFKMPTFIWKYFATQSGMRVGEILRLAANDANTDPEVKKSNIDALRVHLEGALRFHSRLKEKNLIPHKVIRCLNIKYSRYYVSFIYMISKVAFFINVIIQLELLSRYLLPDELKHAFGLNVVQAFITSNETWKENGLFPRVSLCDFEVREMGQRQTHTVQCVLLINLFIEKIFIFLWAWYIMLVAFTLCNICSWMFVLFDYTSVHHFLMNHLEMAENVFDKAATENQKHVDKFINCYLGGDGIFLLRIIAQHADVVFTTELIHELWKSFCSIEAERKRRKQIREEMSRPFRFDIPKDVQKMADEFRESMLSSQNRRPSRAQLAGFVSPPKKFSVGSIGQERRSYDDMIIELSERKGSDSEDEDASRAQSSQSKLSKHSHVSFRTNKFGV